ncbi:hypothetical protein ABZP36_009324 [Zizania latifolia]
MAPMMPEKEDEETEEEDEEYVNDSNDAPLLVQCHALQAQVERLSSKQWWRGLFKWGILLFGGSGNTSGTGAIFDSGMDRTPLSGKKGTLVATARSMPATGTPVVVRWRRSHS